MAEVSGFFLTFQTRIDTFVTFKFFLLLPSTGGDRSGRLFPHRVETVPTDSHGRRQGFEEKRDREVRNLASSILHPERVLLERVTSQPANVYSI